MRLRDLFRRFRLRSVQADEYHDGSRRSVDNIDAMAAGGWSEKLDPMGGSPGAIPPNYVKPHDEGRPRK